MTALGRKTHTDNVLVRVTLFGGVTGWGEASSSLAMAWQTAPGMAAAIRRLGSRFRGRDVRDVPHWIDEAWRSETNWPTAVGAFEAALEDARARTEGRSCADLWGGRTREAETTLTVSAVLPLEVGRLVKSAVRRGWRTLKLKLNGHDPALVNRDRLRAAHRAGPRVRWLLDPNQSYTPAGLADLLETARRDGIPIEQVEEPFLKHDWAALSFARRAGGGPFLLDESLQDPLDARRAVRRGVARGPNIKLAKSGLSRSRAIVEVFQRALGRKARFMIGCMAESRVGLAASVHFALGLGLFHYLDLDSDLILRPTPARGGYRRSGPWLFLPKYPRPGLGLL